jgi:phage tail P2-like protein
MTAPATLLPPSSTPLERALDQTGAVRLQALPSVVASLWNADDCPAALLPYLAWALSVDEWDEGWGVDKKRAVISESSLVHRQKGTPASIRRAIASIGQADADIIERVDYFFHDGSTTRDGSRRRMGHSGWATYRIVLKQAVTIAQAMQIKRLLAACQRNCIELRAVDFKQAGFTHDGTLIRNGAYTRGVVDTSI